MAALTIDQILDGLKAKDEKITKKFFCNFCKTAYAIFAAKYNLRDKNIDVHYITSSLYLYYCKHDFKDLEECTSIKDIKNIIFKSVNWHILNALNKQNTERKKLVFKDLEPDDNPKDLEPDDDPYKKMPDENVKFDKGVDEMDGNTYEKAIENLIEIYFASDETARKILKGLFNQYSQKEIAAALGKTPQAINQKIDRMCGTEAYRVFLKEFKDLYSQYQSGRVFYMRTGNGSMPFIPNFTPRFFIGMFSKEILVFDTDLEGHHYGSMAQLAVEKYGAEYGKGEGRQGQSYAIPTMPCSLEEIADHINKFLSYAKAHEELNFLLTPIGCGLAGFDPDEIAPLFKEVPMMSNVSIPECFWEPQEE